MTWKRSGVIHCTDWLVTLSLSFQKLNARLYTIPLNLWSLLAVCDALGERTLKRGRSLKRTWMHPNLKLQLAAETSHPARSNAHASRTAHQVLAKYDKPSCKRGIKWTFRCIYKMFHLCCCSMEGLGSKERNFKLWQVSTPASVLEYSGYHGTVKSVFPSNSWLAQRRKWYDAHKMLGRNKIRVFRLSTFWSR